MEYGGELRGRGHLVTLKSALPIAFEHEESARRGGAGGCSLNEGGWPSIAESEVVVTPTLGLLKTRPSSSSESIATTPLFLSVRVGLGESWATVRGPAGAEPATPVSAA